MEYAMYDGEHGASRFQTEWCAQYPLRWPQELSVIDAVGIGLGRGDQTGSADNALRAKCECRRASPSIRDTA
jgi:hypothetical protein